MNHFLIALQFLTPFSIGKAEIVKDEALAESMAYFGIVGLLIGLLSALAYFLLSLFLPGIIVSAFAVLLIVVLSRGLHIDGLADTFDGITGGKDKNDTLRIMHDPNVGAAGAAAIVLCLLIKFSCLYSLSLNTALRALIFSSVLSRWAFVFSAVKWKAAPANNGLGRKFSEFAGVNELFWANLAALAAALFSFGIKGVFIIGAAAILAIVFNSFISKKIGGLTGDTFGAIGELTEVFALVVISAATK